MADLSITAANVLAGEGAVTDRGVAAVAITAGQVVYKNAAGKFDLADTDSATAIVRKPYGIALNSAAAGQPISVLKSGPVTIGATVTRGVAYYLSGTAGGICPVADVASGDYTAIIGIATSSTVLMVDIQAPDAVL